MLLARKGLIFLCCLLTTDICFVVLLGTLLNQSESELSREEKAHKIVDKLQGIGRGLYNCDRELSRYLRTGEQPNLTNYRRFRNQSFSLEASLEEDLQNDPVLLKKCKTFKSQCETAASVVEKVLQKTGSDENSLMMAGLQLAHETRGVMKDSITSLESILDEQKQILAQSPAVSRKTRRKLLLTVFVGMLTTTSLGLIGGAIFLRNITKRLAIMVANTDRLKDKLPLNPPVTGNDEISTLDTMFHTMAREISNAQNLIEAVVEQMPLGVIVCDRTGKIEFVNRSLNELLSNPTELNKNVNLEVIFPELADMNTARSAAVPQKPIAINAKTPTGIVPVEITFSELKIGSNWRVLAMVVDLREQIKLQQMRRDFIAMISHDLRSPIMNLHAYLDLSLNGAFGALNESGKRNTSNAQNSVEHLLNLINDLLHLEKAESDRGLREKRPWLADDLIEKSVLSLEHLADAQEVVLEFASTDIEVTVDGDSIVRVLTNLISNAIKFSPAGERVSINCERSGDAVLFSIVDRGPGIPIEKAEVIFEKFAQLSAPTSDPEKFNSKNSSGLGLAIAKAIIEQHGGTIGIKANAPQGSIFWFRLPESQYKYQGRTENGVLPLPSAEEQRL